MINAVQQLFCDCGKEMKRGVMLLTDPPSYEHKCEDCDQTVATEVSYPTLAYREKITPQHCDDCFNKIIGESYDESSKANH
jgi:hypothetical protein